jgi:hypothetical protein
MWEETKFVHRGPRPQQTTLLALVAALTRGGYSEREVEIEVLELVESGRVALTGSFRDTPLRPTESEGARRRSEGGR